MAPADDDDEPVEDFNITPFININIIIIILMACCRRRNKSDREAPASLEMVLGNCWHCGAGHAWPARLKAEEPDWAAYCPECTQGWQRGQEQQRRDIRDEEWRECFDCWLLVGLVGLVSAFACAIVGSLTSVRNGAENLGQRQGHEEARAPQLPLGLEITAFEPHSASWAESWIRVGSSE